MNSNGSLRKRHFTIFYEKQRDNVMNKASLVKMNERNFSSRVNFIIVAIDSDSLI